VRPFAGGAAAGSGPAQAHIKAAPRRVVNVADQPVAALAAAVGKIVAADRLGMFGEAARDVGNAVRHGGLRKAEARRRRRASGSGEEQEQKMNYFAVACQSSVGSSVGSSAGS